MHTIIMIERKNNRNHYQKILEQTLTILINEFVRIKNMQLSTKFVTDSLVNIKVYIKCNIKSCSNYFAFFVVSVRIFLY